MEHSLNVPFSIIFSNTDISKASKGVIMELRVKLAEQILRFDSNRI